jgi:predicted DNA-binding transcriptional regulator AlpA
MTAKLQDTLGYAPRGLRLDRTAGYVGMGKTKFLELVDDGRIPKPLCIDGIGVWDRLDLDAAFETIKTDPDRVNSFEIMAITGTARPEWWPSTRSGPAKSDAPCAIEKWESSERDLAKAPQSGKPKNARGRK